MSQKIRVGILFGGKSAEHEVSLQSAKNVIDAIDKDKYEVVLIGIDKQGKWFLVDSSTFLFNADNSKLIALNKSGYGIVFIPASGGEFSNLTTHEVCNKVDVVFPVLHGPFGEDGSAQGLLNLVGVPFVGSGVLGSSIGMDKDVMKRLLRDSGIPIVKYRAFKKGDNIDFENIVDNLGLPVFVKPANMGSSVGIHKVASRDEFENAVEEAFGFDTKIIIEEYIEGREIECAVLGNRSPIASVTGEVISNHEFYSYNAKYIDENGATFEIPARLSEGMAKSIQDLAIKTFTTLECAGLSRVDFFLTKDNTIIVNEINTMPGFTTISMYPSLWQASGISYPDLIDRLIHLAMERFEQERSLTSTYLDGK